jgi:hypothetical protein
MDFDEALRLSQRLERAYAPELVIVGLRRDSLTDPGSWTVDIANVTTYRSIRIDDRNDVEARVARILTPPEPSEAPVPISHAARRQRRPAVSLPDH